jgi:hypothetical protein
VPVYDYVPETAKPPFMTLGAFNCKEAGTKYEDIVEVTVQLNIWSTYKGKFEINSIANRVISLLQTKQIDLSEDEFTAIRQQVDFFEAYPEEETGYNGVISLVILVQNMRRSED